MKSDMFTLFGSFWEALTVIEFSCCLVDCAESCRHDYNLGLNTILYFAILVKKLGPNTVLTTLLRKPSLGDLYKLWIIGICDGIYKFIFSTLQFGKIPRRCCHFANSSGIGPVSSLHHKFQRIQGITTMVKIELTISTM